MANDYKAYADFSDIEDKRLQAWNRVAVVYNITKDLNAAQGTKYAERFKQEERVAMREIVAEIQATSYDAVRKTISA